MAFQWQLFLGGRWHATEEVFVVQLENQSLSFYISMTYLHKVTCGKKLAVLSLADTIRISVLHSLKKCICIVLLIVQKCKSGTKYMSLKDKTKCMLVRNGLG